MNLHDQYQTHQIGVGVLEMSATTLTARVLEIGHHEAVGKDWVIQTVIVLHRCRCTDVGPMAQMVGADPPAMRI